MEPDDVVRIRLGSQQLRAPVAATADDALKNLLAVQAQEFPYARWSLAQRTAGATADDVEQAVADGRILRTHILRPTWHFVHRDDLPWLRALSAPRLHQANAGTYRRTGIDSEVAAKSAAVLAAAVADGVHRTREQLATELQRAGFAAKGLGLAYLIMHAEVSGVLASGVPVRSAGGALRQTYAAFDERVQAVPYGIPALSKEESLAKLAMRYFRSRGPATVKDCADWSGLTMADVRLGLAVGLEADPGALETSTVDGVTFHFRAPDSQSPGSRSPQIDIVQCYDEYIMGYSVSRHYFGGTAPVFPLNDAPMHVVLLNGRMAGSWRHWLLRTGSAGPSCELDVRLSTALAGSEDAMDRALDQAVARYGEFLGMPTSLRSADRSGTGDPERTKLE
ncbi:winged helix DNA-binding domain-containing protein [Arthrobacter sp. ISL-5]|uniref:winged helix DNA-binding domain-containing protein n=1 Tax=Arthrobacter sp. ISL-5 TaxID=2819111 RepID=UPI001BE836A6|nr:winged helix DNA-binding domain-containing protein [Arthrobacter sp. ISL-5]MBT2555984.1 AlkZ family DNA glycosylase [Arthrobacter sp. ISL-5]